MKLMMLVILIVVLFGFNAHAEKYTGRMVDLTATDRGIEYTVVVEDSKGEEVYRSPSKTWISTGNLTAEEAVAAAKQDVTRKTQEVYAHVQGAITVMQDHRAELESYRVECDTFVNRSLRGGTD